MKVFIVYCHPSENSFTYKVLMSFIEGLKASKHEYIVSDLYKMGFNSDLSLEEYNRESSYNALADLPRDVIEEQRKINESDAVVFIYPLWWSDCPAKLKGWFDRVFTVGFAYGDGKTIKTPKKALFLCTAGHPNSHLEEIGIIKSMETISIIDRMNSKAETSEMVVLGGTVNKTDELISRHLKTEYELGEKLF